MRARDVFSYAFGAIRLRKLRAGLTTLGVVIGIAAIVALLAISQGLQVTITDQLQSGFATDTLIVRAGSNGLFSGVGGGAGGIGVSGSSDFSLLVSDTQIIDSIDNVVTSAAVIQEVSYIESGGRTVTAYVGGVDFGVYSEIYGSTFVAGSGEVPLNPENGTAVVGKRVGDPWQNGTLFCGVGDTIDVVWTNTTVRPPENKTLSFIAKNICLRFISNCRIICAF